MNPFDSARSEAASLRAELTAAAVDLAQRGYLLAQAACERADVKLKNVKPTFALLKSADATINVQRRWLYVRADVSEDFKAFLVAHELGHLRLHPAHSGTVEVTQDALSADASSTGAKEVEGYGSRERQELQANVFAREFLLPREDARSLFMQGKSASTIAHDLELPLELVRLQLYDGILLPPVAGEGKVYKMPDAPTPAQRPAVESSAQVSLVQAGPGTGKTTALLLRLRRLIGQGVDPASIVILTFSNKAARELVERARAGKIPGADRVWIGTFHAFGLEFLRKFGHLHGLESRFPVLDKLASLAMLEADLPNLELSAFDPLSNTYPWLEEVLNTIRRVKDEVLTANDYQQAVADSAPVDPAILAKRQDVAKIFHRYELLLARRKSVDLTDLLCVAIRLLGSGDPSVAAFKAGIKHVLVDEYQDVNRASALLVREISQADQILWVVGDTNQAIYAFMGASSTNLATFEDDFPGAQPIPLAVNHRSSQEIVDAFCEIAKRNPEGRPTFTLEAEMGAVGHGPRLAKVASDSDQIAALAWRIRQLQTDGVPLAEQAVIVFRNSTGAKVASDLEAAGVPVLFLGNIFERAEIKDLICLLQLAIDRFGVNLVRPWGSPLLALSREGADKIFAQSKFAEQHWMDVGADDLSQQDAQARSALVSMCRLLTENDSPWDALAKMLLEDGRWLRELSQRQGQASANARMAVWQFVHFCRAPDGTGRWSTVKNLPLRIRDRVRMGEDRSTRAVPPEAEGMDAVRILTAHGSKGLEFDAVHLVEATKSVYEPSRQNANKLMPEAILSETAALKSLRNERHNLLYVAGSRPRLYLTVYAVQGEDLPAALAGLLQEVSGWTPAPPVPITAPLAAHPPVEIGLREFLEFVKCPRRHEFRTRAGAAMYDELKLYRAVIVATDRAMRRLMETPSLQAGWEQVARDQVAGLKVEAFAESPKVLERVIQWVGRGQQLLAQSAQTGVTVPFQLGSLRIILNPEQVLDQGGGRKLRFIRSHLSGTSLTSLKRTFAALLDANKQAGGPTTEIEISTLSDGEHTLAGRIQPVTRLKYQAIGNALCASSFPPEPDSDRICSFCPYMFPCDRRVSD